VSGAAGDLSLVQRIEEYGFNAWPARRSVLHDGWLLRQNGGYTRRANSATPRRRPGPDFPSVIQAAEAFYRAHDLPVIFRLTPLASSTYDVTLERAGYVLEDPSLVMTKPLDRHGAAAPGVTISPKPDRTWAEGAFQANGIPERFRPARQGLIASIAKTAAFATVRNDGNGQPVAFGLAVAEDDWVGLFDIVVRPEVRRRGFGQQLVAALLAWGTSAGARQAYLQVGADNIRAQTLYEQMGFTPAYAYHYRVL
jgi:GNAT superfamily N-acetyltransferase